MALLLIMLPTNCSSSSSRVTCRLNWRIPFDVLLISNRCLRVAISLCFLLSLVLAVTLKLSAPFICTFPCFSSIIFISSLSLSFSPCLLVYAYLSPSVFCCSTLLFIFFIYFTSLLHLLSNSFSLISFAFYLIHNLSFSSYCFLHHFGVSTIRTTPFH